MILRYLFLFLIFSTTVLAKGNITLQRDELPDLKQEKQHSVVSERLSNLLLRSHYKEFKMDDAFSKKIFDEYLSSIDSRKMFFTQSSIESFKKYEDQFSIMIRTGYLDPAYKIYYDFQQIRYTQLIYSLELLNKEFDFSIPDQYMFDRDDVSWAKDENELKELWRQRVKLEALNLKLTGKKWDEIKTILTKRYQSNLNNLARTKSEDVFQVLMNSFTKSVEAHTSYLSPRNAESFAVEMNLKLEGIGAVLQTVDDYTVIKSLITGGPAEKSHKLKPEDKIIAIAQGDKKMVDVIGWRIDDVVQLIKGPKGTKVRLQILSGKDKTFTIELKRETIRLEDQAASSQVVNIQGENIGIIDIPSFYNNLTRDVLKEIKKLRASNIKGLIIDLRYNGGGALTEATLLTGLFIQSGPVVQIREENSISENIDDDINVYYTGPLTILINRYSASASEIFAAALQDYGRAIVLGESSYGKGTVQQHKGLSRLYDTDREKFGHVQYTIAKFYRINGGSTQIKGVTPDILFPSALKAGEYGESESKNALPWDKIAPAEYELVAKIPPMLIDNLSKAHEVRIKNDPEFKFIYQEIEEYKKQKNIKSISLVEEERIKQRDDEDAKSLERINFYRAKKGLKAITKIDDNTDKTEDKKEKVRKKMGKTYEEDPFLEEASYITFDLSKSGFKFFAQDIKEAAIK